MADGLWRKCVQPGITEFAVVALLLLALTVALQFRALSYSEFAPDEASHYVSGLLVHDFLRAGLGSPIAYLRDFHSYYPLVGIGHWGSGLLPCRSGMDAALRVESHLGSSAVRYRDDGRGYDRLWRLRRKMRSAIALLLAAAFVACRISQ